MHEAEVAPPVDDVYFPAPQVLQLDEPALTWNVPAAQLVHPEESASPTAAENFPEGHKLHDEAPDAA